MSAPLATIMRRWILAFLLFTSPASPSLLLAGTPVERSPDRQIRLWFGGDVHFGNAHRDPLLALRPATERSIGIVNLEGPVHQPADTIYGTAILRLYNAPRTIDYLRTVNVQIATVANNHQDDAGRAGKNLTERSLRDRRILPVGGNTASLLYRVGEYRLIVASYALSGQVPPNLADELAQLRRTGDVLIVLFHVAGTQSYLPHQYLRQAVDIAIRSKASIIVSHGSHAIGPVERRADAVIAWGLGNLAFNCRCTDEAEAVILAVTLDPSTDRPLASACVIPIDAGMLGAPSRPAKDAVAPFDLLDALGSSRLTRQHDRACF